MVEDLLHPTVATGGAIALLGYAVVFFGLVLLMIVVILLGKIMIRRAAATPQKASPAPVGGAAAPAAPAPGTAGRLKLYDVPDRDAAMVMAIVANRIGKPLNELRFRSIKEVK